MTLIDFILHSNLFFQADLILQARPGAPVSIGEFSFLSLFKRADWVVKTVMIILLLASLWSWAIAINKFITIRLLNKRAERFEDTFWSGRTLEDLSKAMGNDLRDPMARVFSAAMQEWEQGKKSSGPRSDFGNLQTAERVNSIMNLVVNRELSKAERGMNVLATVASSSVFIGLFGTVWGIMNSFRSIAVSQNTNLAVVAPGIAEALFATAMGLIAAIPALIFYNWFSSDINRYAGRLEGYADELSAVLGRRITLDT